MSLFHPITPVILNLFSSAGLAAQDPFLPMRRSAVGQSDGAIALLEAKAERAARWMLKQVQHDEFGKGSVLA